jgi:hypothetical protein
MMELKQKLKLERVAVAVVLMVVLMALLMVPEGGDLSYLYAGF